MTDEFPVSAPGPETGPAPVSSLALADLAFDAAGRIIGIAAEQLEDGEARRLESLGFVPGEIVSKQHGGGLAKADPLAIAIGRTLVALRRRHAAAIMVQPL